MPKHRLHFSSLSTLVVLICLSLPLFLGGCEGTHSGQNSTGVLNVVTSINQWHSLATELGGTAVKVKTVIQNTSTDAHDYEPTTADIALISHADLVIVNGAGVDTWASKAAQTNGVELVDLAKESGHKTGDNPHIWFSADVRLSASKAINDVYRRLRPQESEQFNRLHQTWAKEETRLKESISKARTQVQGRKFAATESVANYLTEDLGMKDRTPQGYVRAAANESEPSPEDIRQFQELLRTGQVELLVFNTQEANGVTDQITGTAMTSKIPIVRISEQMPSKYKTLENWIEALIEEFIFATS